VCVRRFIFVLFLLGHLPGCVRYRPAPLEPERTAAALAARRLDNPGLKAFVERNAGPPPGPSLPQTWNLETLTAAAIYFHPDLDVARAEWQTALAALRTAGERDNPDLALEGGRVTHSEDPSPWILGFDLDATIVTAGKRRHRIEAARARGEAQRLKIGETAWQVRRRVREALLDAWDASRRAAAARRKGEVQREIVAMLERRLEVGEASRPELTRERLSLARIAIAARDAERDAVHARAALAASLSVPAEAVAGTSLSFAVFETDPSVPTAADAREIALSARSDLRSLLADYAAAEADLRLEVARQYPDLRLGPGYTFEQGERHFLLGLSLPLPVLNRNRGKIGEAEARRQESAARFMARQAEALGEADGALAESSAAASGVEVARSALALQRQAVDQVVRSFRAGASDRLTLRTAELELAEAEEALARAEAERQRAVGRLESALRRPLTGRSLPSADVAPRTGESR
jgi:outer membrane protein TolC